jgi:hypothetical protein
VHTAMPSFFWEVSREGSNELFAHAVLEPQSYQSQPPK